LRNGLHSVAEAAFSGGWIEQIVMQKRSLDSIGIGAGIECGIMETQVDFRIPIVNANTDDRRNLRQETPYAVMLTVDQPKAVVIRRVRTGDHHLLTAGHT